MCSFRIWAEASFVAREGVPLGPTMELVRVRTLSLPSLPVPLPSLPLPFPFFLSQIYLLPNTQNKDDRPCRRLFANTPARLFVSHPSRRHPTTHLLHQTKLSFLFLFLFLFSVST